MKIEIKAPSPGESVTQVTVSNWLAEDGSFVSKNEEIAEIESEKATLTVSSPESGKLQIIAGAGQTVNINETIAIVDSSFEEGEENEDSVNKKKETAKKLKSEKQPEHVNEYAEINATPLARSIIAANNIETQNISAGNKKIKAGDVLNILNGTIKKAKTDRGETEKAITPLRKKLSERLVSVKNETAMLTTFNEVDMSAVIAIRKEKGEAFKEKYGVKLGFMSFFGIAVTRSLIEFPNVNSSIAGENQIFYPYVDLGIAVQTEKGLMVPVIKNAQDLSFGEMEKAIFEMAEKARNKKISLDDLKGGTFTITNGGVFGSLLSTPIINPPQAGILGMHNIVERPIALNGQVVIRPMMYIALSYDHRIIDGKDSVLFLKKVKSYIEEPGLIFDL